MLGRWITILIYLCLLFNLNGCGSNSDSSNTHQVDTNAKADLTFICRVPTNTLDPQKMSWLHDIRIASGLYEPLVRYSLPELTLEGGVASHWQISDDKKTYTFHLRPEAKWSNGDPVIARHFVYAWRRALLPDFAADYASLLFCIEGAHDFFTWRQNQLAKYKPGSGAKIAYDKAIEKFTQSVGITAVGNHTLVVKLQRPTPYFIELCAFATLVPNHVKSLDKAMRFDQQTGMLKLPANFWTDSQNLITNGPYILAKHQFKQEILLTANQHWWNKASMNNQSIRQKIIENPQAAILSYQNGHADWIPSLPTASSFAADLVASGRKDVHTNPWAGTYFYSFNCKPKLANGSANPMADPRVRRALSMAIDRKTIVSKITRMNQPVALSFIPPNMIPNYLPPTADGCEFDPLAAKQLLKEAGYDNPAKLRGLSILMNTDGGHEGIAQAISHMWQTHLGINVPLESLEVRSFREKLKKQHYTIARASWMADYRDPTTFLDKYHSQAGNNDAKWLNPQFDRLLRKASQQTDAYKRMNLLQQAESLLLTEQAIAPIFHYINLDVFDPDKVKHHHPNPWNFHRLEQIQVIK